MVIVVLFQNVVHYCFNKFKLKVCIYKNQILRNAKKNTFNVLCTLYNLRLTRKRILYVSKS